MLLMVSTELQEIDLNKWELKTFVTMLVYAHSHNSGSMSSFIYLHDVLWLTERFGCFTVNNIYFSNCLSMTLKKEMYMVVSVTGFALDKMNTRAHNILIPRRCIKISTSIDILSTHTPSTCKIISRCRKLIPRSRKEKRSHV